MDLTGKTVIEVLVPENVIDLSVENLPQGLYMLRATFTDGSENIKKLLKN